MTVQSRPIVEVAVGILLKEGKEVLMGKRPEGKPYAGYWEFPGGKLEAGESVALALHRELKEELGIVISLNPSHFSELITLEHDYPHAYVRLHVCLVQQWQGEPTGLENQALFWQSVFHSKLTVDPVLPAAWPMIEYLQNYLQTK
jgi:8-oxo-dGTP diphosphatase